MPVSQYTSGNPDGSGYNVTIEFLGMDWTDDLQDAFIAAADFLSTIIAGDIPSTSTTDAYGDPILIDDLYMTAELVAIDGENGVLGLAGPTQINGTSLLPSKGLMRFDTADAQNLYDAEIANGTNQWSDVVLHEMMHVVGVGTMWDYYGLSTNFGTDADPDWRFTGEAAIHEYNVQYPDQAALDPNSRLGVPIQEDEDGPGGHWDESVFDNELMTPFLDIPSEMTAMTLASLQDIGYDVNYTPSKADVPCFGMDTLIETASGVRFASSIKVGDVINSRDHGLQTVRAVRTSNSADQNIDAFEIKAGSLGPDAPERDVVITGSHRIMIDHPAQPKNRCAPVALITIRKLFESGLFDIRPVHVAQVVHIECDRHVLLNANGLWSESYLEEQAFKNFGPKNPAMAAPMISDRAALDFLAKLAQADGSFVNDAPASLRSQNRAA